MSLNVARAIETSFVPGPAGPGIETKRRHGVRAEPRLSIVLVAMEDVAVPESLSETLAACEAAGVELVYVARASRGTGVSVHRAGAMRTLAVPADATAAELRAVGMATANGDIVTVCELPARGDEPGFMWPLAIAARRVAPAEHLAAAMPAPRI